MTINPRSAVHPWSGIVKCRMGPAYRSRKQPNARTVGAFVPQLTRKSFEKFGFSTAALIMDWSRIAGQDLAAYTVPERVSWPRAPSDPIEADPENPATRPGATLYLRVDPARALDVEYRARQIVERINTFFGYRAISGLRLVQAPVEARSPATLTGPYAAQSGSGSIAAPAPRSQGGGFGDDPLGQALARLEASVNRRTARQQE